MRKGKSSNRDFAQYGVEAVPAIQRLREFYAVPASRRTRRLILGAGGVGSVVLRTVFERRSEIGLLHALGYERATMWRLLFAEHGLLVLAGMAFGAIAATASIVPLVVFSQTTVSLGTQVVLLALIIAANIAGVAIALFASLSRAPLADLHQE